MWYTNMKKILTVLAAMLLLSGCNSIDIAALKSLKDTSPQEMEIVRGCREIQKEDQLIEENQLARVSDNQIALVLMHRDSMREFRKALGKDEDPCRPTGTNVFDVVKEDIKQRGETTRKISGDILDGAKTGGMIWLGGKLLDGIGDHISLGDNSSLSGMNSLRAGRDGMFNLNPSSSAAVSRDTFSGTWNKP